MTTHTYKEIVKKAEECYNNVQNHHKLGMTDKWSYPFAQCILKPHTDFKKIKFNDNPNPKQDQISVTATKAEYLKLAKDLVKFVETKGRLPNYITFKNKKVAPRLLTYDFAKIIRRYNKTKKLQDEVKIVSSVFNNPNKLHDYLTSQGCSGMGQCTSYYCGCNALQQCFYRLTGIKVDESVIAGWAGTTTSGTDHEGLNTAVAMFNKKYNKNVKIEWYNFSELGFDKCRELMKKGALFFHLLYRNKYGHYEVPKAIYENTLDILNSLGDKCSSTAYCGYIENRTKAEQKSYISGISQKSVAYLYNR